MEVGIIYRYNTCTKSFGLLLKKAKPNTMYNFLCYVFGFFVEGENYDCRKGYQ